MSLPGKKRELPVVRWSYPLLYFPAKGNLAMKCSVKSAPKVKEEKWGRGDLKTVTLTSKFKVALSL